MESKFGQRRGCGGEGVGGGGLERLEEGVDEAALAYKGVKVVVKAG